MTTHWNEMIPFFCWRHFWKYLNCKRTFTFHSSLCFWHSIPVTNIAISHSKCNYSCNWGLKKKNGKEKLLEFIMKPPNIFLFFTYLVVVITVVHEIPIWRREWNLCIIVYRERKKKTNGHFRTIQKHTLWKRKCPLNAVFYTVWMLNLTRLILFVYHFVILLVRIIWPFSFNALKKEKDHRTILLQKRYIGNHLMQ